MMAEPLERELGHAFIDRSLLQAALTHRSFGANHNERLEFLGDGVLNCVIAATLYKRFPALPEGDLSRLRAQLVCQDSLEFLANRMQLGGFLRLGEGELRSGGSKRPSILADALEALFGAIYLDGGYDLAAQVIGRLYGDTLASLSPDVKVGKDAKTRLQEWLQARKKPLPKYVLLETAGAAHEQTFTVACEIGCLGICAQGSGQSRRIAEQAAAQCALLELNV